MKKIHRSIRSAAFGVMLALPAATVPAIAIAQQAPAQQAPVQPAHGHHSKLKGAIVGGVAGHVLGGHAKAGAAAGALWQHHKNRKEAKAMAKGTMQP